MGKKNVLDNKKLYVEGLDFSAFRQAAVFWTVGKANECKIVGLKIYFGGTARP